MKVEATKYTEIGYHGRDVDSMIRDLLDSSLSLVRSEMYQSVKEPAEKQVEERLLDHLLPRGESGGFDENEEAAQRRQRTRDKMRQRLRAGEMEDTAIEISMEDRPTAVGLFGQAGMEMDVELQSMVEKMLPARRETRRLTVREARSVIFTQEAEKLIDKDRITRTAIERVEQSGIIFIDELDKICGPASTHGPDVSRQGVQRDLLPIVEGSTVMTRYGPVRTDYILFIAAGAFHASKAQRSDARTPGPLPHPRRTEGHLTKDDFVRILHEPQNSLTRQHTELLATEGIHIDFTEDAIDAIAQMAYDLNRTSQNNRRAAALYDPGTRGGGDQL